MKGVLNMASYKKAYALRVDEPAFEKLKIISNANHRSVNSQIEALIEQCITDYEKQNGEIHLTLNE